MRFGKKVLSIVLCVIMVLGTVAIGGDGISKLFNAISIKAGAVDNEQINSTKSHWFEKYTTYNLIVYIMDTNGYYDKPLPTEIIAATSGDTALFDGLSLYANGTYARGFFLDVYQEGYSDDQIIKPDGSTTITIYIARQEYQLIYISGEDDIACCRSYRFEEEIYCDVHAPYKEGYMFDGWFDKNGEEIPETMPRKDVYLYARWIGENEQIIDTRPLDPNDIDYPNEDPNAFIEVNTAEEFDQIRNEPEKNYILKNDIDLSEFNNWIPIDGFSGVLNGNGFTIKNITISVTDNGQESNFYGLFGKSTGGFLNVSIENINISVIKVESEEELATRYWDFVGSLVAYADLTAKKSRIKNCYVNCSIEARSRAHVGGVVGFITKNDTPTDNDWYGSYSEEKEIVHCSVRGCISSYPKRKVWTSENNQFLFHSRKNCAGGIVGEELQGSSYILNCENNAEIISSVVGGIIGEKSGGEISNSINTANLTGECSGGICGNGSGKIKECINYGTVYGTNEHLDLCLDITAGGICGYSANLKSLIVSNCINYGDVLSFSEDCGNGSFAGGIVGLLGYARIDKCSNYGNVKSIFDVLCDPSSIYPYNHGSGGSSNQIYTESYIMVNNMSSFTRNIASCSGGLIGFASSNLILTESYNYSTEVISDTNFTSVTGRSSVAMCGAVGGLIGAYTIYPITFKIENCFSYSKLTATDSSNIGSLMLKVVGGLIGCLTIIVRYNESAVLTSDIINCYSYSDINTEGNGLTKTGSFIGNYVNRYDNSYNTNINFNNLYFNNSIYIDSENDCSLLTENCHLLNDTERTDQTSYVGFDFDKTWTMAGDPDYLFPELINNPLCVPFDEIEITLQYTRKIIITLMKVFIPKVLLLLTLLNFI